jgi:hypothetical protein
MKLIFITVQGSMCFTTNRARRGPRRAAVTSTARRRRASIAAASVPGGRTAELAGNGA